jgi:hypothetical protein
MGDRYREVLGSDPRAWRRSDPGRTTGKPEVIRLPEKRVIRASGQIQAVGLLLGFGFQIRIFHCNCECVTLTKHMISDEHG